jgi:serine/threonine-protein kinase HipA
MKAFEVYAGWMIKPKLIGICNIEMARGNEVISFSYEDDWLEEYPGFVMDPEIYPMSGRQFPPADKKCFGFLSDVAPDRWGRKLMDRRETIDAREQCRAKRTLMESDYILGVNDKCRCGGIRLFDRDSGVYLSDRNDLAAPPMEKLRDLEVAALNLDDSSEEKKWLNNLIDPGSSLGGARPKANVVDVNGDIWIAKFPSKNDSYNVGAWEMTAHALAVRCGISVPEAELVNLSTYGGTYLSKRFDRHKENRIHFASAMTMLGQTDDSDDDVSYIDIAGVIETISEQPDKDLKELWYRMIFNICICNTDDHLRNHGFVLGDHGWCLSPAFDINPCIDKQEMSLTILYDKRRDISEAIEAADFFRLTKDEAREGVEMIRNTIERYWRYEAGRYRICKSEQDRMAEALFCAF